MSAAPETEPLLELDGVSVDYPVSGGRFVHALTEVDVSVRRGEVLGLVGESGCGKSTLSRAVMQLVKPSGGTIRFDGTDLDELDERALREMRHRFQIIFQDPVAALNPRRKVRQLVAEGLVISGDTDDLDRRVDDMLLAVGLDPEVVGDRRPRELSGGQCQRVCIARALSMDPELLVCDEPVSALDVLVQAQILNLLTDLRDRFDLTVLFVSHDLLVVRHLSDRVAVMYLGRICEIGPAADVFDEPAHPYTELLLRAIPGHEDGDEPVGELPSPIDPPSGCRFRTRCPHAHERCAIEVPELRPMGDGRSAACHLLDGEGS